MKSAQLLFWAALVFDFAIADNDESMNDDILHPYEEYRRLKRFSTNANRTHKVVNTSIYETWTAHTSTQMTPVANVKYFVADIQPLLPGTHDTHVYGHHTIVRNPLKTFSVLEAVDGGCEDHKQATVAHRSKEKDCIIAQNGGYFDTKTFSCHGNVISDGTFVQNAHGIQNVHFGITTNNTLVTGYLSENDIQFMDFEQLIGGVIWLVKNGRSYVEESIKREECVQETGTLRFFSDVQSARTAIGHDKDGHIVFVQIDGQTKVRGADLHGFARFLIDELKIVNAINLDGGGSATLVLNGSVSNYPSDHCKNNPKYRCARHVSTLICAHPATCSPNCLHGTCINGRCHCEPNWVGLSCNKTLCSVNNCTRHGNCTFDGCVCHPGWHGNDCSVQCENGRYGNNCSQLCRCRNGAQCHPVSGICLCGPGYHGDTCDSVCPAGKYGAGCNFNCHCTDTCLCHPETGTCHKLQRTSQDYAELKNLTICLASNLWNMTKQQAKQKYSVLSENLFLVSLLCASTVLLVISLSANFVLLWKYFVTFPHDGAGERDSLSEYSENSDSSSEAEKHSTPKLKLGWKSLKSKITQSNGYQALNSSDEVLEMNDLSNLIS